MTDTTRVLAFRTIEAAQDAAGFWTGLGYNVAVIVGTDSISLSDGSPPTFTWESGAGDDWNLVIASKKEIVQQA